MKNIESRISFFRPFSLSLAFPSFPPYLYLANPILLILNAFRRFIRTVPAWAFALVMIVIFVDNAYLIYRSKVPVAGATIKVENGYNINDFIIAGSPLDQIGIMTNDTLVSINSIPVDKWEYTTKVGDTLIVGLLKNNQEITLTVVVGSLLAHSYGFYWTIYLIIILLSVTSLFILFKKPHDRSVTLFFIYLQLMAIVLNAGNMLIREPLIMVANVIFHLSGCLLGPILIHFHLLFPRPIKSYSKVKWLTTLFYILCVLISIGYSMSYIYSFKTDYNMESIFYDVERFALLWIAICFVMALAVAVFQYITIKDTLSRNQIRMVIIGSFFGLITPITLAIFYYRIYELTSNNPNPIPISQALGSLIMVCFFFIAIFRYRIWDMEIFIRKALLYLGATLIITLSYLILIYFVDQFAYRQTNLIRFLLMAISVIIFLVLRDRLQNLINRIFHRETYDSATVVSEFEEKLAGIFKFDELKSGIARGLDDIFHFRSLVFNLKKEGLTYAPVHSLGPVQMQLDKEYKVTTELEKRLQKSKAFSPAELDQKPALLDVTNGELIVPLLKDDQPYGFFLCGPKKSEKPYSMQDIRVLSLIAKRVIALFHTANLYQKDLERQLMLERERARISQDMHDDVGASLTRISILSDLAKNKDDVTGETKQWLGQISDTSRGVMEEMSQIIWALNPKNDTLEGLVAYLRRFANEFLEPTTINCFFDLPEILPARALSVEARRNVYLVVREVLHNVVKHSGATKVLITMKLNEHGFRIMIKDDGKGFDPGNLEFPGNGLINMKKRMNDIGGEFAIRSEIDIGTEIEIVVVM
jgi:signal transduction histidine kinase